MMPEIGSFKKAAVFTDLHIGLKGNSPTHNLDCVNFVDWFIDTAKKNGCDTGIFMGDFHHNRNNINMLTMSIGVKLLEKLGRSLDQFIFFPGNHDLYYKDRRDVHSVEWAVHIPGVTIIRDIVTTDGITFVPWLVGDEWKTLKKVKSQYVFGHFELPDFLMNAQIRMPDHGLLNASHFDHIEYAFSGHFHKRQQLKNVIYIGNAFPHNYGDSGDRDRGMMILEAGGVPEFINWPSCPYYDVLTLSQLIDRADTVATDTSYLKVNIDIDVSFEEATFVKETFVKDYHVRELMLVSPKNEHEFCQDMSAVPFESVDMIVSDQILKVDSKSYDPNLLLEIYNSL